MILALVNNAVTTAHARFLFVFAAVFSLRIIYVFFPLSTYLTKLPGPMLTLSTCLLPTELPGPTLALFYHLSNCRSGSQSL